MALSTTRIYEILETAKLANSPVLQTALDYERNFRAETAAELGSLIQSLRLPGQEPEALKKEILGKLKVDSDIVGELNKALQTFTPAYRANASYKENECTFPLKNNKMTLAIKGATELVEKHFDQLIYGGIDSISLLGYDFSFKANAVTILGDYADSPSIFGNSKGTYLKTAALTSHLVIKRKIRLQDALTHHKYYAHGSSWIDSSVMAHVTVVPKHLDMNLVDPTCQFTYSFFDSKRHGFAFVHNGYTFGGHRSEESIFLQGKYLGPEDCSSFVSKMTDSVCHFTTSDQLCFYRAKLFERSKLYQGVFSNGWHQTGREFPALDQICEPVVIKDPLQDIKAGQIYCHKTFNLQEDPEMLKSIPGPGHTGIVVGCVGQGPDSQILIMAADRNMPEVEGFGIQSMPLQKEGRKVMLFSSKAKNTAAIESSILKTLPLPQDRIPVRFTV